MDPIILEIMQEGLISIVKEMRANLSRTAYSSVINEAHDFSYVIMGPKGQLVAQAEDNPSHIFPIPWSVRAMRKFHKRFQERYGHSHPEQNVELVNLRLSSFGVINRSC